MNDHAGHLFLDRLKEHVPGLFVLLRRPGNDTNVVYETVRSHLLACNYRDDEVTHIIWDWLESQCPHPTEDLIRGELETYCERCGSSGLSVGWAAFHRKKGET